MGPVYTWHRFKLSTCNARVTSNLRQASQKAAGVVRAVDHPGVAPAPPSRAIRRAHHVPALHVQHRGIVANLTGYVEASLFHDAHVVLHRRLLPLPHLERCVKEWVLHNVGAGAGDTYATGPQLRKNAAEHLSQLLVRQMVDDLFDERAVIGLASLL